MITFTVPGPAVGKQRARVTRTGHAYTPSRTTNYEALIKQTFAAAYPGHVPLEGPIVLKLDIYVVPSQEAARRLKKTPWMRPTIKPDIDNILKLYADSLNGLAYRDDKQIVGTLARKFYGDAPRVEVAIEEVKCGSLY